jgi:thiamine biosynthesis protein ThiS
MKVIVNGQEKNSEAKCLFDLVDNQEYVAVAHNEEVIPRKYWKEVLLKEGDRIEIVIPFQGG